MHNIKIYPYTVERYTSYMFIEFLFLLALLIIKYKKVFIVKVHKTFFLNNGGNFSKKMYHKFLKKSFLQVCEHTFINIVIMI